MKKNLSFLLAVLLTLGFMVYLLYNVDILRWYGKTSVVQWGILLAVVLFSGTIISSGYNHIASEQPGGRGQFIRSATLLVLVWGTLIAVSFVMETFVKGWLEDYPEVTDGSAGFLVVKGIVVGLILSLLVIWIDYSWFVFARYTQETISRMRESRNKKELQFRLLRSQLTPHFLFNSLNTASNLISNQPEQAEEFIRKLAFNFTNLLENGVHPLNTLAREMEIIDNYMHLMKVRYGEKIVLERRIKPEVVSKHLPALAIQLLVENAIKHNVATVEQPLKIIITADLKQVVVANILTQPPADTHSTGIGLQNLMERYRHHGGLAPSIYRSGGFYEIRLPYIVQSDSRP